MSWLFKDPAVILKEFFSWLLKDMIVRVAWLNSYHAQPNSKKQPKKIKLTEMIFSWQITNKILMYLWAPFIVQNLKNIFRANLEFLGCVIFGSDMAHLPWINFFWYKPLLSPSSTY